MTIEFGDPGTMVDYGSQSTSGLTTWKFVEVVVDQVNDIVQFYFDGQLHNELDGYLTGDDFSNDPYMGFGYWYSSSLGIGNGWHFDDVYIDYSPAHVLLCTGSTYSSRGQCEMQIASSWSSTAIKTYANGGAFSENDSAYMYVVNASGEVNYTGYSVVVGDSGNVYDGGGDTDTGTVNGTDTSTYGTLAWQQNAYTVERIDGYAYLTITRASGSDGDVAVEWTSSGDTAVHATDYYGENNATVEFGDGVTSQQVAIELIQNYAEEDRSFTVTLSDTSGGASLGSTISTTVTILGTDSLSPPSELRVE
jgi:hypothetical protein